LDIYHPKGYEPRTFADIFLIKFRNVSYCQDLKLEQVEDDHWRNSISIPTELNTDINGYFSNRARINTEETPCKICGKEKGCEKFTYMVTSPLNLILILQGYEGN